MLRGNPSLLAVVVAGLIAGCAGGDDGPTREDGTIEALLQDRTGVLLEEARIDGGAMNLVAIRGLLVADDGTVIVSQPRNAQVRFFGPSGEPAGAIGSRGQAPGEFTFIGDIGWLGDTVWVHDPAQGRLTFVSPDREVVRTQSVPPEVSASGELAELAGATLLPLSIGADGSVYSRPFSALPGAFRDSLILVRVTPDGVAERIVARVPQGQVTVPTPAGTAPAPFPNPGLLAASRSADRFAGVFASLDGSDAGTFVISMWSGEGTELWSRQYRFEPVPIPPAVADSVYEVTLERVSAQAREAYAEAVEIPEVFPPFAGLRLDAEGRAWLALRARNGERRHLVFDPEGRPEGMVTVPRRGQVAEARGNHIWVIERDDFDVESVVRYAVEWR